MDQGQGPQDPHNQHVLFVRAQGPPGAPAQTRLHGLSDATGPGRSAALWSFRLWDPHLPLPHAGGWRTEGADRNT